MDPTFEAVYPWKGDPREGSGLRRRMVRTVASRQRDLQSQIGGMVVAKRPEESISNAAINLLKRQFHIKDPIVLGVDEDVAGGHSVYRVHATTRSHPNTARQTVVMDHEGREVDVEELSARGGRRLFAAFDPVVEVPSVPRPFREAVTIAPTENVLALSSGETVTETVTVRIPKSGAAPKVDVYFLADTTSSMGDILDSVKTGTNNILSALNDLNFDMFFGVGNYKDFQDPPEDPYCFQHQQSPTGDPAAVAAAINAWTPSGGRDGPEGQLFALNKLAEPPGSEIGWRDGKRIIVWFGDYPGHDPICSAISGEPAPITEASVTSRLVAEKIVVLAISVLEPGLNADPKGDATDYVALCGPPGGQSGQGTNIASATGGQIASGLDAGNIVGAIIKLVTTAVGTINNVSLVSSGGTTPFVESILPAGGYGPLDGNQEHTLTFEVAFKGVMPCRDKDLTFTGTLDGVADGEVIAQKRVLITVPACLPSHVYSVKFLCGEQRDCSCECTSVRPGVYATEINIHNYHNTEITIEKFVTPVIFSGAAVGREPKFTTRKASDRISLPAHTATMDDCCRIAELLLGGTPPSLLPLTVGFLEIVSSGEVAITAVYTVSDLASGAVSIDVEQIGPASASKQ